MTVMGLALVYWTWRQRQRHWPVLWLGWGLLVLSVWAWMQSAGTEFGVVFALFLVPLVAWLPLLPQWRGERRNNYARANTAPNTAPAPWLIGVRVLALLVFTALCSTLVAVALVQLLPVSHLARLVWALLFQVLFWGLLAIWLCAAERVRKPIIWSSGFAMMASVFLLFLAQ
ncbi:hypothetical protein R50072_27160 [Simiduia litorea]